MSKFKIGDRVRFIKSDYNGHPSREVGGTGTIESVLGGGSFDIAVDGSPERHAWAFDFDELELMDDAEVAISVEEEAKLTKEFSIFAQALILENNLTAEQAIEAARKIQEASE